MKRFGWLVNLSLVLLLTAPFACTKNYSTGPQAAPTPTPTPAPELYLAIGDSISTGYGLSDVSLSFVNLLYQNNGIAYPSEVGEDLSTKYPGIQLLNLAVPGSKSFDVINSQMPSVPTGNGSPRFVTLIIGGNELINSCGTTVCDGAVFGCTAAEGTSFSFNFKARVENQIVKVLQNASVYPRLQKIVIGNIYDPTDGTGLAAYGWPASEAVLAQYNQRILEIANETGAVLVDDYTLFLGHGTGYNNPANPNYDSADPTFWYNPTETPFPIHPYTLGHHHLKLLFWPDF